MLALRLGSGLDAHDHAPDAWGALVARYGAALEAGVAQGRLERLAAGFRIPDAHRFVADDTIAWLAARGIDSNPHATTNGPPAAVPVDTPLPGFIPSWPCPNPHSPATRAARTSANA